MLVEYHPATVSDLNRAIDYYDSQRRGLGGECRAEIYRTIDLISDAPKRFRRVRGDIRRCIVKRFPLSVLYRLVDDSTIRILVIRHHRQDPGFGEIRR